MSDAPVTPLSPVERRLRLRRWVRRGGFCAGALLALSILMTHAGLLGSSGEDWSRFDRKPFVVIDAPEGDLLTVRPPDGGPVTRVRLIGVDAPDGDAHWATEAKQHLLAQARRTRVTLALEPTQTRSPDGALLAYVHLGDNAHLNLLMVRDGHAYADRRTTHSYQSVFDQEEAEARRKAQGLWKDLKEDQMPEWRRQWLAELRQKKALDARRPATTPVTQP